MSYSIPAIRNMIHIPQDSSQIAELWIPQSISYSFQIAEYIDSNNKVIKSRLEVSRNIHDQYGTIIQSDPFIEVPRVQRPV